MAVVGEQAFCAEAVREAVGTPALQRLAKKREYCMPYWSRGPQDSSHAPTMPCAPQYKYLITELLTNSDGIFQQFSV